MSQPATRFATHLTPAAAADLTLTETLRVLEVARSLQKERSVAEQALARHELRDALRRRLLDAAVVTGDTVTEADIDTAIDQYFARLHDYVDPPMSFSILLAHVYVRRFAIAIGCALAAALWFGGQWAMGLM